MTSPAFEKFTDQLLDEFRFNDGFMLNAGEFQGTSSNWGIIFSNFENKRRQAERQKEFLFSIKKTADHGGVEEIRKHKLRRIGKEATITKWATEIKKDIKNIKIIPRANGGFQTPAGEPKPIEVGNDFLGFLEYHGFMIQNSDKYVHLNSTSSNDYGHGYSIYPENFERMCVTFSVRKSILPDASWYNDKDVFASPSIEFQSSPEWQSFVRDCVVYSLFQKSSYQSSLRGYEYGYDYYDVENNWFFMSRERIKELAEKEGLNEIYYDATNGDEERFVYNYLKNKQLSPEARELLDSGIYFVERCFKGRLLANAEHPEYSLMAWDAGYYQNYKIYRMLEDENINEAYEKLDLARKKLETKIRRQVYADGILNK